MLNYLIRRLILLPITLFAIILVNFVIINLAPGDPVTVTEISPEGGATRREDKSIAFGSDDRYLQFREHYGLTLPILLNTWPFITKEDVLESLNKLTYQRGTMSFKDYDSLRVRFGDQARFVMKDLLAILSDPAQSMQMRSMASKFFIRGGYRQAFTGPNLTEKQMGYNQRISKDNEMLASWNIRSDDSTEEADKKARQMGSWYADNKEFYRFEPSLSCKVYMLFFNTRFFRYLSNVLTLNFGTLRNDNNKTVISEVAKRFKYSLTLAIIPMLVTFAFCQVFGFIMAYTQNRVPDLLLNFFFLVLYAIPIFVVAPFLIEKVALNRDFPFTNTPIPISGFTSPDAIYNQMNSGEKLMDILRHIFLPIVAIMYGSMAAESRLSRTAILEVLRQDYVRTAWAKGVPPLKVFFKHIGRNASITIVTSLAGSLGVVLGGSLIVETLFDINGFGKFFYDAILNRDYNVIMFSTLAGSFLALLGYLAADIAYTLLDPRVTLE